MQKPNVYDTLFAMHVRPILKYCYCVCNSGYSRNLKLLESVQRRRAKKVVGLKSMNYAARFRELKLFSIKGSLLRADLIKYWKIVHRQCEEVNFSDVLVAC